jgi:replicative DNA helicase
VTVAPPSDTEAERGVVGSVLIGHADAIAKALPIVRPTEFTGPVERLAYAAMASLYERGEPLDTFTVAGEMKRAEPHVNEPHSSFLVGCMAETPSHMHIESYARRVRYCATARNIISTASDMAAIAYGRGLGQDQTEEKMLAAAYSAFESLTTRAGDAVQIITPKRAAQDYFSVLDRRQSGDQSIIGYPLGFFDLDRFVALRPGEYVIVAAEPSVGKTAFMGSLHDNLARENVPTLFASVEQPMTQIMDRAIAWDALMDSWKLSRGSLGEDEFGMVSDALARRQRLPGYYIENSGLTTQMLDASVYLAKAKYGIKVVFVDYVQILADRHGDNETARIGEISHRLRRIARRHNITLVAASQVSKSGNLRWAGELEQDADVILKISREPQESLANIYIQKNRSGQAGLTLQLFFDQEKVHFRNPTIGERAA